MSENEPASASKPNLQEEMAALSSLIGDRASEGVRSSGWSSLVDLYAEPISSRVRRSLDQIKWGEHTSVFDHDAAQKARELEEKIAMLKKEIDQTSDALNSERKQGAEKAATINSLKHSYEQLREQESLSFLLSRVNAAAQAKLLKSDEFRKLFLDGNVCDAFVMSVDIRRSTELMLKAKTPQEFAKFITTLCRELQLIILNNFGVFDKFTGDGVLAFFPEFFSGKDAGFYAIVAAQQCHQAFEKRYREFRSSFTSVLTEVGLGIGVDYGQTHLVRMAGGLTVVGAPVVYACRMSGAPPGSTLLNQQGYERISHAFSSVCFFEETELEVKHEGKTLAYRTKLNAKDYTPTPPSWTTADA